MYKTIVCLLFFLLMQTQTQAQIVSIPDPNFKTALLNHGSIITGPGVSTIDTNGDGEIQVSEAQAYLGAIIVYGKSITDLTGIQSFPNITALDCGANQLTHLDVSNNTALTNLACPHNLLDSLDLINNVALSNLTCTNNQLHYLNIANNASLSEFICDANQLTHLDISNNTALTMVNCSGNLLSNLNLSHNTALTSLACSQNQLTYLDLSNNITLNDLSCNANQLSYLDLSNHNALTILYCDNNLPFLTICVADIVAAQAHSYWVKDSSATYTENCHYPLTVQGTITLDTNNDCVADSTEQAINNILISFVNNTDTSYALTNGLGAYQAYLDTGSYTITAFSTHPYMTPCPANQSITVDSNYQVQNINFAFQKSILCPYLKVDISTPLLRRCFNSIYYINYCNKGTLDANNAYIEVELDSNLYFNSSSIPLISQTGNLYRFNIGNLPVDSSGSFSIDVTVSCHSQLGQYHCASAYMYPDNLCLTSLPNIHIADTCLTDSIAFVVSNQADLVHLPYLLLEDSVVVDTGSFSLNMGQATSIVYPTGGDSATYQLVLAHGDPIHYAASTLVGCHPNAASSTLLHSPNLPQDFAAIDCTPNRGSYDPNDKTGYPIGYGNNHYINPNTSINYRIRFQNTGTDTAIFINILDTISPYLDISTLTIGIASHPYNLTIMPNTPSGEHVLRFEFDPIHLPDSNVNEPASHGFVHYSIAQLPNLPNGTIVNNSASIYFDYNAPVKTNTTLHTICDNCLPNNFISIYPIPSLIHTVKVAPNPFSNQTRIELQGYTGFHQDLQLDVYDLMGRRQQQLTANEQAQFILHRKDLSTGIYFFQITEKGRLLQSGQLSIIK